MQYFFYCHHEHEHSHGRLDRSNVMSIHEAIDYAFHLNALFPCLPPYGEEEFHD